MIDPHLRRFPAAVESALFHLLLNPWETWSTVADLDWRGFRVPWFYTIDDDLFVHPKRPPSPDDLSLEPLIVEDAWGEEVELERPTTFPLEDAATTALQAMPASAWFELEAARATPLFETPVEHFLVRAFLTEGIDEFMAHITAIEAAFGLELDHRRPKGTPHPKLSSTKRVAARHAAASREASAARDYQALFKLRSEFVHGRSGLNPIPSAQRVLARALARRAAVALVGLAAQPARPREFVLADLLDQGVPML